MHELIAAAPSTSSRRSAHRLVRLESATHCYLRFVGAGKGVSPLQALSRPVAFTTRKECPSARAVVDKTRQVAREVVICGKQAGAAERYKTAVPGGQATHIHRTVLDGS
eukprot:gene16542-11835_t